MLEERALHLREVVLEELRGRLVDDRAPDVLADYERALAELTRLRSVLAGASAVEDRPDDPVVVELGDLVTMEVDGAIERVLIVDPVEASLDDVRISVNSPLSRALLGHRVGDVVEVVPPVGGAYSVRVLGATRPVERPPAQ
jgi:transcription elongation factor GreA